MAKGWEKGRTVPDSVQMGFNCSRVTSETVTITAAFIPADIGKRSWCCRCKRFNPVKNPCGC